MIGKNKYAQSNRIMREEWTDLLLLLESGDGKKVWRKKKLDCQTFHFRVSWQRLSSSITAQQILIKELLIPKEKTITLEFASRVCKGWMMKSDTEAFIWSLMQIWVTRVSLVIGSKTVFIKVKSLLINSICFRCSLVILRLLIHLCSSKIWFKLQSPDSIVINFKAHTARRWKSVFFGWKPKEWEMKAVTKY